MKNSPMQIINPAYLKSSGLGKSGLNAINAKRSFR